MIRISIHLPTKHRLDLKLVKKRKSLEEKPLLPNLGKVLRSRKGNKFSRFFRHIFEHKRIKKILGSNLVLLAIGISILPASQIEAQTYEENIVTSEVVLTTQTGIQYPVNEVKITSQYHLFHPGIDFDGLTGDPIRPIMAGKVVSIYHSRFAYGNSVLIAHDGGISSFYAHLSKIDVYQGQEVDLHIKIGEMGATGRASGDHLHLEVYEEGKPINPLTILPN